VIWRRADRFILSSLLPFIVRYERFNISLTSRLAGKRGLTLPNPAEATLYAGFAHFEEDTRPTLSSSHLQDWRNGEAVAVVLITRTGSIFPLLSPDFPFSSDDLASLLSRVIAPHTRLFSLLGTERDVSLCWPHLDRRVDKTLSYYLMTRNREMPLPDIPMPFGLRVLRLTPKNSKRVFPLEEQYQHEEVLVHPERYNRNAHMLHFKKVASMQHVIFAEDSSGPVAKAGTNSLGISYCQIGGVYTLPPYRRLGLSKALMVRVLDWGRQAGLSAALFVQKDNRAAVELYRSLSFDVETDYRIIYMKQE